LSTRFASFNGPSPTSVRLSSPLPSVGDHPFGVVPITPPLPKTQQHYDLSITVNMPESPRNLDRGNFMISLLLLDTDLSTTIDLSRSDASSKGPIDPQSVIFTARRPALVPYTDPIISLARRLALLPLHLVFPQSHAYSMTMSLAEGVVFPRTSRVPKSVYVELLGGQDLQTYDVSLTMTARLRGLRWILHNYRILSFVTLTLGFWSMQMLFAGLALFALGAFFEGPEDAPVAETVEAEEDEEEKALRRVEIEEPGVIAPAVKPEKHEQERAGDDEKTRKEAHDGLRRRRIKQREGESSQSEVKDEVVIKQEPESD
jgi:hypothetical protein